MTTLRTSDDPDERLLEEALGLVRDARDRLPRDYLVAIAALLGVLAAALLVVGMLVDGRLGDLAINLSVEVLGALLTVVVIDGLWSRAQTGSAERLRTIEGRLRVRIRASHGGAPLRMDERAGWQSVVNDYQELTDHATLRDRLTGTRDFGRRAQTIERQAESLLRLDATDEAGRSGRRLSSQCSSQVGTGGRG